ncbi:acrylyl-CoA reductase (NADPH) [Cupriavidus plantarum]|uniref:Acrylyl-CoA reductase (NADPH) n=2 Tax=Cupriavidus plantarum TaxID=942865 RepID=A0A316EXE1_9BURK|nr:acrylyl-CoA reductase (NADPH) [Cupriavidus plantarum]
MNARDLDAVERRIAALLDTTRQFAADTVTSLAGTGPHTWAGAAIRAACARGMAGIEIPGELGGLGLPFRARTLVARTLAEVEFAFAFAFINHHNAALRIAENGTCAARGKYVPAMLKGELIGCTAMTERGAGSDFTAIAMRARRVENGWRLTGDKQWIASAAGAEVSLVFAQTDASKGANGIACFIVDLRAPGCVRQGDAPIDGLELAGIGGFALDDCFVPDEDVLYAPGAGFRQAMAGVNKARVHIAAMACGVMRSALETATAWAASRTVYGQPVLNQQGVRWSLVDASAKLDILDMLTQRAAQAIESGDAEAMQAAASAKLYAGNETESVVSACIQAMGARGMSRDTGMTRRLMAARALCLADGSNEVMRDRLGASLAQRFRRRAGDAAPSHAESATASTMPIPSSTFRALFIDKAEGGATRCDLRSLDKAALPEGDVLVRVSHSTLNYKDALAITGRSPVVRKFPMVPGIDFAGVVERSADARFAVGDAVVLNGWGTGETHWGGLAEYAVTRGDWLVPLPAGMSARDSMSIGTAGYTAMLCVMALQERGVMPESGPVLVTGANGGVGTIAISILSRLGYAVTASTGRSDQADYLVGLGANGVIDRGVLAEPGKPLQKEAWAAAVDCVGGHTLANVLATTRYGGVVAACGLAQSMDLPATVAPFILRAVSLIGIDSVYAPRARRLEAWSRLAGQLDPAVLADNTRLIGLGDAIGAAQELLEGKVRGRLVVDIDR